MLHIIFVRFLFSSSFNVIKELITSYKIPTGIADFNFYNPQKKNSWHIISFDMHVKIVDLKIQMAENTLHLYPLSIPYHSMSGV